MKFLVIFVSVALGVHVAQAQAPSSTALMSSRAAGRLLDQATWGPNAGSIAELRRTGLTGWLDSQFSVENSDIPDQPVLGADGKPNRNLVPVYDAFFENALTKQDQLRQRVAFALSEIWVVSATAGVPDAYAFPPYWRIFRDNAFANYRDVIKAVTLNPAMGRYLNMANNNKGNPAKGTSANENYARELMQLFTLGLVKLNPDGSAVLDQNHQPVPTYDQDAVSNMAKALTGWTYPTAPGATPRSSNPAYYLGQMFAVESYHDTSAKMIFDNIKLAAGHTAEQDLESVLDALMQQTTMAPFVSQQLIQHLVTSNPSPGYIERVSKVFLDNGRGVRGDMKAVVAAILTDPEARAGDDANTPVNANFGHMREPILFMTNVLRGLDATLTGTTTAAYSDAAFMGQDLFHSPSVFSYFSPRSRTEKGLFGPEFQIYSTQTAANRADVVYTALYGTLDKGTKINLAPFLKDGSNLSALLDYISYVFLHGAMSNDLRQAAHSAASAATTPAKAVQAALYIVLTSGEYQIIH
ncbi:MAG: DUF1800 domain-containing protein [Acidobacteriota bacterium]|nr:DUF1800 domain-containing protein [Acidobacteriota bacterium]